ncbi:hypothetical protein PCASD_19773 [Puccinia coronata f. sp. avenae]|uniref:Uncharacterized protein n=1 Tax=Puccinia coronata f. sp. avenae TaxID=200324 RepID=A0A2N5SLW1_9BASI|nr:hypothetical protein PCASD_19773 [Puccinia coronata f. sp. avenae]
MSNSHQSTSSSPSRESTNKDSSLERHSRGPRSPTHFFYTREALLQLRPTPVTPLEDGQHPFTGNGNHHPSIPAGLIIRHQ